DRRLDASLGQFDDALRKEQERTAQQRDSRAAGGAAASGSGEDALDRYGSDGDSTLARNRAGDLRSEGAAGGDGGIPGDGSASGQGGGVGVGGSGSGGSRGSGVAAREIPAGDDDDIIARRLRKAAETETDPELKDKLWQEYIDYKQNTQRGG